MAKEEEKEMPCCGDGCCGGGAGFIGIFAALLIALGIFAGMYVLSQADLAPNVNVQGGPAYPNVYVSSTPPDHEISASATATTYVDPDLLSMQVSVKTEDTSAKKSQSDNAAVVADLLSKLKALGLEDKDIQTSYYSVDPIYDSTYVCDKNSMNCHYDSTLTGYRTTQSLVLNVYDLTKGGDIIDAASSAGENQTFVDYISFTLRDSTRIALQKSLLVNASSEAKSKATKIAEGLGETLGDALSASESYSYYPTYTNYRSYAMEGAAPSAAPSTTLSQGQIEVSTTVSASFEIQ